MEYQPLIAFLDPEGIFALFIPVLALLIPIVAILAAHQQKMARILHGGPDQQLQAQLEGMRIEIERLKSQVRDQAIALQQVNAQSPAGMGTPPVADPLQDRVGF